MSDSQNMSDEVRARPLVLVEQQAMLVGDRDIETAASMLVACVEKAIAR